MDVITFEIAAVKRSIYLVLLSLSISQMLVSGCDAADVQSIVSTVNGVRTQECARNSRPVPLQRQDKLDQAALLLANGRSPHDAAASVGYQATQLASIHLTGYSNDAVLKPLLRQHYCANLSDRNLQHIGVAQRGDEIWILLGAQLNVPRDAATAAIRVLELVNQARAQARSCGSKKFAPTTPLTLDAVLTSAARVHSEEMAKYSYLEHQGRDGSTPAQRVTRAGYLWNHTGENIAGGPGTPEEVVAGWLTSPGHCANIMTPAFTAMGVAYALSKDDYGIYWTQVFATPRR